MKLAVLGSSSYGNCYILTSDKGEQLIIEAGVPFKLIKQALNFDLSKVCGAIVSHSHSDHARSIDDAVNAGINVYADIFGHNGRRKKQIEAGVKFAVGDFKILPFAAKHDVPCLGFVIRHQECGNVLFITDSLYVPYTFKNLNNILIETNFCEDIVNERLLQGANGFVRDRVIQNHLSIQVAKQMLQANDLTAVNNICLIHLSDSNSHAERFRREVTELTGKNVHVAEGGMEIDFNRTAF